MVTGAELVGEGYVVETPQHGPLLCLGGLAASLPPQGSGPAISNWDWTTVSGYTILSATTWGAYTLIGTYDGHRFTMTRPPQSLVASATTRDEERDRDRLRAPCPDPPGGWRVLDPSRTSDEALSRVVQAAQALEGYADVWLDQSRHPLFHRSDEEAAQRMAADWQTHIVIVAVTGDTAVARAKLREFWGGPLCVTKARHTAAELMRVREELTRTAGLLALGHFLDHVDLQVIHDDGSLQRALDARYGAGLVAVSSALKPYRA
jgi:hypothetical protein